MAGPTTGADHRSRAFQITPSVAVSLSLSLSRRRRLLLACCLRGGHLPAEWPLTTASGANTTRSARSRFTSWKLGAQGCYARVRLEAGCGTQALAMRWETRRCPCMIAPSRSTQTVGTKLRHIVLACHAVPIANHPNIPSQVRIRQSSDTPSWPRRLRSATKRSHHASPELQVAEDPHGVTLVTPAAEPAPVHGSRAVFDGICRQGQPHRRARGL